MNLEISLQLLFHLADFFSCLFFPHFIWSIILGKKNEIKVPSLIKATIGIGCAIFPIICEKSHSCDSIPIIGTRDVVYGGRLVVLCSHSSIFDENRTYLVAVNRIHLFAGTKKGGHQGRVVRSLTIRCKSVFIPRYDGTI